MIENALAIGSVLEGATTYTIEKQLHQGGFGITYFAKAQIMVGNIPQVAMFTIKEFFMGKICARDSQGRVVVATENQQVFKQAKQDFREEAEILHSLKHTNIVPVNEVFEQNNTVYYVMAYLGNVTLYQYVSEQGGVLPENQAKTLVTALSGAISYLHNCDILHLDIKPENIMMVGEGTAAKPVLIDFGQALYFVKGKPKREKGVGGYSKGYSPIELKQPVAEFLPSLDIYSLAATLLYMLTGKEPCDAAEQSIHKIYRALPENISQNTLDAIICGMQKDGSLHLQNISDFQNVLLQGKASLNDGGSFEMGGNGHLVTDSIVSNSSSQFPAKKIGLVVVGGLVVLAIGWTASKYLRFEDKPKSAMVTDTVSVSHDTIATVKFVAQTKEEQEKEASATEEKTVSVKEEKKTKEEKVARRHEPNKPSKKETATSGFVNLGYATWIGGLLNGKPHGNGRMKFHSSHAIGGCSTVPGSGDYIDGYCENGVLQSGALYQNGVKVESFVR